jgi:hypothetical protein
VDGVGRLRGEGHRRPRDRRVGVRRDDQQVDGVPVGTKRTEQAGGLGGEPDEPDPAGDGYPEWVAVPASCAEEGSGTARRNEIPRESSRGPPSGVTATRP